jgi:cytoskeletal protein CcmA (bactofilin family)
VEGSILLEDRVLTLAEGAQVTGDIAAGSIIVSGTVTGSIEATQRLDLRPTAVVEGELSTPVLVVADGARVSAEVEMPAREPRSREFPVAV